MNNLKLVLKDKLILIVAALLAIMLLACIPFVPSSAKYTKTEESTFTFKIASGVPVLRLGVADKSAYTRLTFRQALGEAFISYYEGQRTYANWGEPLDEIYHINIVQDYVPSGNDVVIAEGNNTVTESGEVSIYWNADTGTVTISAAETIYANAISQELFKGNDAGSNTSGLAVDYGFSNLKTVDLANLETSTITTITSMFDGCTYLEGFDFNQLKTTNVLYMSAVFKDCKNIKTVGYGDGFNVNLETIDTSKSQSFENLFQGCTNLEKVDISTFNTASSTNFKNFFEGCTNLKEVVFGPNFSAAKANDLEAMFYNCSSIEEIDLSGFAISSGQSVDLQNMFRNCTSLKSVDISSFNTDSVKTFSAMFKSCSQLTTIDFGENFTTKSGTTVAEMFSECSSLTSLGNLELDLSSVSSSTQDMFNNCSALTNITFANGTTNKVETVTKMFNGCAGLTTLDLSKFNLSSVTSYTNFFGTRTTELVVTKPSADMWNTKLETAGTNVRFV